MQLTVYFASPFYVGVLEAENNGLLYSTRHVFGPEPNNEQVRLFVLEHAAALYAAMISDPACGVPVEARPPQRRNPKREQREIRRQLEAAGPSRKAHEAMRRQYEQRKTQAQRRRKPRGSDAR